MQALPWRTITLMVTMEGFDSVVGGSTSAGMIAGNVQVVISGTTTGYTPRSIPEVSCAQRASPGNTH